MGSVCTQTHPLTIIDKLGQVARAPCAKCSSGGVLLVIAKPTGTLDLNNTINVAPAGHALQQVNS